MKLRLCKCRYCKANRKDKWSQASIKRAKRRNRQQCRIKLIRGNWELIDNETPGVYTD